MTRKSKSLKEIRRNEDGENGGWRGKKRVQRRMTKEFERLKGM